MPWRQWWHASLTAHLIERLSRAGERAVMDSRSLRWIGQLRRHAMADRRRLGAVAFGACAVTALAAPLWQPELRTLHALGVRGAVLLGVGLMMSRVLK